MNGRTSLTRRYTSVFCLSPRTVLIVLLSVGATLLALAAQVALSRVFDYVVASDATQSGLLHTFLILGGVMILSLVCNAYFVDYLPVRFELHQARDTMVAGMDDLLNMPVQTYHKQEQGYFYNMLLNGSLVIGSLSNMMSIGLGSACLSLLVLLGVAYWIQPLLVLCILLYMPVVALLMYAPTQKQAQIQLEVLGQQDQALGMTKATVERKKVITTARAQAFFLGRFVAFLEPWIQGMLRLRLWQMLINTLPGAASALFKLVLLGVSAKAYLDGRVTVGTLLLTYQLAELVQAPLTSLFGLLAFYRSNLPHVGRLKEFCDLVEEPSGFEGKFTPSAHLANFEEAKLYANGEKERLLFAAPHMTLPRKGLVVIKGANGSGKSMLVNYLTGFGEASAFEGKSELNENLQKASYLTYPLLLTKGSFTDNLFGKGYDQKVAQMLGIDFFEKEIDDEKVNLSFGEGQKLNLLRVLSSPSPVLVLDEPFTNLDKETIARLTDYLMEQKEHKAIIAITHSHELDAGADAIYAIRDGELVCEKG